MMRSSTAESQTYYKGSTHSAAIHCFSADGRTQLRCTTLTRLRLLAAHSDSQIKQSSDRAHTCRKLWIISSDEAVGRGSGAGRMLIYSSLRAATSSSVCRRNRADTATSCCPCAALRPSSGCAPRGALLSGLHSTTVCSFPATSFWSTVHDYRLVDLPPITCRHHHWLLPLRRAWAQRRLPPGRTDASAARPKVLLYLATASTLWHAAHTAHQLIICRFYHAKAAHQLQTQQQLRKP